MERITPPCCSQAWAKATGKELTDLSSTETSNIWAHGDIATGWKLVPDAESAEWLAEIVEAAHYTEFYQMTLKSHGRISASVSVCDTATNPSVNREGVIAPDLRRALCAALNGSPCKRKAA